MRTEHTPRLIPTATLVAGALLLAQAPLPAQTFNYTNGDLVAGFRLPGGSSDLVVNLGPASAFENLAPRSVVPITNLAFGQLADALPTLDGVRWSVAAAMRGNYSDPHAPLQTLWVTSPCPDLFTPGLAWQRKGPFTQGTVAGQIDAIGAGAVIYGNSQPAGPDNTRTGIVLSATDANSYTVLISASGDFSGTFQGNAENLTPTNFVAAATASRSVLYKLVPISAAAIDVSGQAIGFFDLKGDGTMTFTAGPPAERTLITLRQMSRGVNTVSFATTPSVYYRLRFTGALATPIGNWSTNGAVAIGDGTVQSLQDTNASNTRFYAVESF